MVLFDTTCYVASRVKYRATATLLVGSLEVIKKQIAWKNGHVQPFNEVWPLTLDEVHEVEQFSLVAVVLFDLTLDSLLAGETLQDQINLLVLQPFVFPSEVVIICIFDQLLLYLHNAQSIARPLTI